jgi:hypothetical protein
MSFRLNLRCSLAIVGVLALSGCQQQPPPATVVPSGPTRVDFSQAPESLSPTNQALTPDDIVSTDPTASRLQDIGGYVLLYYRENDHMPASLDELRTLPGGEDLRFNSASTGQAFGFVAPGLWPPQTGDKCIIVYDSTLVNGKRWCLFMTLPRSGEALNVDVECIPDSAFQTFHTLDQ